MTGRRVGSAVAVACLIAACTPSEPRAGPDPTTAAPTTAATTTDSAAGPTTSQTPSATPPATRVEPLALVVDVKRPPLRLTEIEAETLIAGDLPQWSDLGEPGGRIDIARGLPALTRVLGDEDAVGVVAASKVTPLVQVATVAGIDPLLQPGRYPITVEADGESPVVTRLTIAGDIMLGRRVGAATPNRPGVTLQPMSRRLASADLTVGNLESTLSDDGFPTQDDSFAADPRVLGPLTRAGIDVLSLANNHTGDFGERALRQTLARLDGSSIERVGAGYDDRDAWRPVILEHDGVRFGFVAFNAIGETPRATPTSPGAAEIRMQPRTGPLNGADLRRVASIVQRLERRTDVVVALPHWGDQYTNQAVPGQGVVGAALLDAGADIVVGGHPHWVQGVDVHDGALIVNSLGNFVFDMDFSTQTQQGVLLDVVCWDGEVKSARFTPYVIGTDFAPRVVQGPVAAAILAQMWATSDPPFRR